MFSFIRNCQTIFGKKTAKVAVPFCVPTISKWEFLLCCILASIWCCLCPCSRFWPILMVRGGICILICISLMICSVEHLFMCLFSICVYSLMKCLLKSLPHFPFSFGFLIVELQEFFVYVGQQSFIRYIFSSIFSQSMAIWFSCHCFSHSRGFII